MSFPVFRTLVKSAYQKNNFLISQPKHMLWVLKRAVSMRTYVKTDGQENIFKFMLKNFVYLNLWFCNHLTGEDRAGCFTFIVFLMLCGCYCSLPLPPVPWVGLKSVIVTHYMSQCMRFPTMWHFEKSRLR